MERKQQCLRCSVSLELPRALCHLLLTVLPINGYQTSRLPQTQPWPVPRWDAGGGAQPWEEEVRTGSPLPAHRVLAPAQVKLAWPWAELVLPESGTSAAGGLGGPAGLACDGSRGKGARSRTRLPAWALPLPGEEALPAPWSHVWMSHRGLGSWQSFPSLMPPRGDPGQLVWGLVCFMAHCVFWLCHPCSCQERAESRALSPVGPQEIVIGS